MNYILSKLPEEHQTIPEILEDKLDYDSTPYVLRVSVTIFR